MPFKSFTGSRPDHERRQQIIDLRSQGYSLAAIGRRLHVSKQSVYDTLARCDNPAGRLGAHCQACGIAISQRRELITSNRRVLCLACLGRLPQTSLGQRLNA